MENTIYHHKSLIFTKAASDTVVDMVNAIYPDKSLKFIKVVSN